MLVCRRKQSSIGLGLSLPIVTSWVQGLGASWRALPDPNDHISILSVTLCPLNPLHIFDPLRNLQLQGFAGRAATTTIHDATETVVSISGIFQAAEDFAVLGFSGN
jgi:hypothetical protein